MTRSMSFAFAVLACAALLACKKDASRSADHEAQYTQWEARIAALDDAQVRKLLDDELFNVRFLRGPFGDITPAFDQTEYQPDPYIWLGAYDTADALATDYISGLAAMTHARVFRGDVDIARPFSYPFDTELTWDTMVLEDGRVLPITETADGAGLTATALNFGYSLEVEPSDPDVPLPAQINGHAVLMVPQSLTRLTVTAADLGREITVDGVVITMTAIDKFGVTFELTDLSGAAAYIDRIPLVVAATDRTGQFLRSDAATAGAAPAEADAAAQMFDEVLGRVEDGDIFPENLAAILEENAAQLSADYDATYEVWRNFSGEIETVELLLGTKTKLRTEPITMQVQVSP